MGRRNYNQGGRQDRSGQSRRQRRLNPQSPAGKNVRRREITRKIKYANVIIKKSLGSILDKLASINKLLGLDEQRERRMDDLEKRTNVSRTIKAAWEGAKRIGGLAAKGAVLGSVVGSLLLPKPEPFSEDEAPNDGVKTDQGDNGVRDFNGAKIVLGPNVDLSGVNPDFWKRFTAAVREYQTKHNGRIVRLNEGYRSKQRQEWLVRQDIAAHGKRTVTAAVGRSMHQYGFALDMNSYEANEMDRLNLLKKYGLGRPDRRYNRETGEWEEAHHIEDMSVSAEEKARIRDLGVESEQAENLRLTHVADLGDFAPPSQGTSVPVTDETIQQGLEFLEEYKKYFAQGGTVEVIAGEAGKEAVIPMNQRGAEYLASAIKTAFENAKYARSRRFKGGSKFESYLKNEFLPELKRKVGKA